MTTIAYKDGILAADSCVSLQTEAGGSRKFQCEKLFRKMCKGKDGKRYPAVIALAGESSPGMVFLDWFGTGKEPPRQLLIDASADFTALVLTPQGLFEADAYCRLDKVIDPFYAIGSGAKAALGAMHAGATARAAVGIACKIDPYSMPPILFMSLPGIHRRKVK